MLNNTLVNPSRRPAPVPKPRPARPRWAAFWLCCVCVPWLAGCENLGLPRTPLTSRLGDLPTLQQSPPAKTVVDTADSELDIELEAGAADFFVVRPFGPASSTQSLPDRQIRNLSFSELGIYDAMVLLLEGSGFALSIDGSARGSERYGAISLFNLSGSLNEVLARISEQAGLFYQVRDNTVVLTPEAQFVIDLPPVLADDSLATITNSLQHLGARDVYLDRLNRTLVFKTNQRSLVGIRDYMGSLRERRSLLVYEVHVYQVDLSDNRSQGISWNGFTGASGGITRAAPSSGTGASTGGTGASSGAAGAAAAILNGTSAVLSKASGSFAMGAVLSGNKFTLDALLNFLQSQGTVKALSRPRIALVSGGRGQLRVGQSTTFVSKVGSNTLGVGANQVTVETQTLNTGFELTLNGDVHDGTVYTRIALNLSDILKFNQFTALGTQLNLPQTSNREVKTTVRARPGDVILLGGILVTKDASDQQQGLAGWLRSSELQRSELVLALKPRVVRFAQAKAPGEGAASGAVGATGAVAARATASLAAQAATAEAFSMTIQESIPVISPLPSVAGLAEAPAGAAPAAALGAPAVTVAPAATVPRAPVTAAAAPPAPPAPPEPPSARKPTLRGVLGDLATMVSTKSAELLRRPSTPEAQP